MAELSNVLSELEAQAEAKAAQSSKVISWLEKEVEDLKNHLKEQRDQHETEVCEVREKAVEETESCRRIHEAAVSQ